MKLPRNGKVVIIDDDVNDVVKLMTALSHECIPFVYFQSEDGEDLPIDPLKNVRLVFLDLELQTNISGMNNKQVVGVAMDRLERILGSNNGPYLLVIWSTKYEEYGEAFLEEIYKKDNKEIHPVRHFVLEKKLKDDKDFEAIKEAINTEIDANSALKAMLIWESIINESAGEITNNFVDVAKIEDNVDLGLNKLLYKLAQSSLGKQIMEVGVTGNEKVNGCYSTLNQALIDTLEQNIKNHGQDELFNNINITPEDINDDFIARLNTQLHLSIHKEYKSTSPGRFAFCIEELKEDLKRVDNNLNLKIEGINNNSKNPNKELSIKRAEKDFDLIRDNIKRIQASKETNRNRIINDSILRDKDKRINFDSVRENITELGLYIELNVSPQCDFAQKKMPYVRILPGMLVREEDSILSINIIEEKDEKEKKDILNKKADYLYVSDFSIRVRSTNYRLILDFRYLYSEKETVVRKRITSFRIKDKLLNDIQVKLSGHVNRVGLLYL